MSMAVGSVSPSVDTTTGAMTRSGTGAALAIYDGLIAAYGAMTPAIPTPIVAVGGTMAGKIVNSEDLANQVNARVAFAKVTAAMASGMASMVTYMQANATADITNLVAHVTTQQLGQTPNPNNPYTPIVAPNFPVNIPTSGGNLPIL